MRAIIQGWIPQFALTARRGHDSAGRNAVSGDDLKFGADRLRGRCAQRTFYVGVSRRRRLLHPSRRCFESAATIGHPRRSGMDRRSIMRISPSPQRGGGSSLVVVTALLFGIHADSQSGSTPSHSFPYQRSVRWTRCGLGWVFWGMPSIHIFFGEDYLVFIVLSLDDIHHSDDATIHRCWFE